MRFPHGYPQERKKYFLIICRRFFIIISVDFLVFSDLKKNS